MPTGTSNFTRKDATQMATWDPILLWYAKAVGVMKSRPANDPTSWIYQAAIHGFTLDSNYDPFAASFWKTTTQGQNMPSAAEQKKYWAQCQHGSWFFPPWHRMYIGYFEQIVRSIIIGLQGPSDWALPYWGYEDQSANAFKLPAAFFQKKLPDGTTNPLYEPQREHGNNGADFLTALDVSTTQAFAEHTFTSGPGPHALPQGFGGPETGFDHLHNTPHGGLESQPHDVVHGEVGELMGDPNTAGYDPIFYLHHANIDRLWSKWLTSSAANQNPNKTSWLNFAFNFHDASKAEVKLTPSAVLDTTGTPFHYQYDNVAPAPAGAPLAAAVHLVPMTENPLPQMVGASSDPNPLTSERTTMKVRLFPLSAPLGLLGAPDAHYSHAYVLAENVRCKGRPAGYRVYLNVPEGAGKPDDKYYIGAISTFGLLQASTPSELHPGSGLTFTFDATKVINLLKSEGRWNPELLDVTFEPRRAQNAGSSIEVGRVSLHYA